MEIVISFFTEKMVEPPHYGYGLEKANASRDSGTNSVVQTL